MKNVILTTLLFFSFALKAETKYSTTDYINNWKVTAVDQMNKHKIPASITLAQGILESGNGNSRLAKQANNHFGIKCHTWNGDTFYQDDDKKNECFRAYQSASESYRDHSLFLQKKRYAGLFELDIKDYKRWAKGLKSAGYATNPKYANLLIDLIEKYNLNQYDDMPFLPEQETNQNEEEIATTIPHTAKPNKEEEFENEVVYKINKHKHSIQTNRNKATFVTVKKGDTFYSLSKELNLTLAQLYKYNEFKHKDVLFEGDLVYIAPLKNKAKKSFKNYTLNKSMTLREIAHQEGIKIKKVLKYNGLTNPDKKLPKGTTVILR